MNTDPTYPITPSESHWKKEIFDKFGTRLAPKQGENWQQLYERLKTEIFATQEKVLQRAASFNCENLAAKLILQDGLKKDLGEPTPLMASIFANSAKSVEMLLRLEVDLTSKQLGLSPLHWAIIIARKSNPVNPDYEIVNMILQKITHLESEIIFDAAINGDFQLLRLILQRGFNINTQNHKGESVLIGLVLAKESNEKNLKIMNWLIEHGAKVNLPDDMGKTPLHYAIGKKDLGYISLLWDYSAEMGARDNNGNSCLDWALFGGDPVFIEKQNSKDWQSAKFELFLLKVNVAAYSILLCKKFCQLKQKIFG